MDRGSYRQVEHLRSPWFLAITALFITTLITANIIAVKLVSFDLPLAGTLFVPAAMIVFPISYILGDVLTEVYGYQQARRVIWLGFFCNLVAVLAIAIGGSLPSAPFWDGQESYDRILGYVPRILAASFIAYLVGEFTNSAVLSRLKVATEGRWLWTRTISSTVAGQGLDSAIFILIAFAGIIPAPALFSTILTQWTLKVAYEILVTPLTYVVVDFLKKEEGIDHYDRSIDLNPIAF